MRLIEVDVVGAQTPKAIFNFELEGVGPDASIDLFAVEIAEKRSLGIFPPEPALGGDDGLVSASLECLADDRLAVAEAVNRGGVDEVDAEVESGLDEADGFRVIRDIAPGGAAAEHPSAEGDGGCVDAGWAERKELHGMNDRALCRMCEGRGGEWRVTWRCV